MRYIVWLAVFAIVFQGCKKEETESELSPATQEGKNIIAFKLDGKVCVMEGEPVTSGGEGVYFNLYAPTANYGRHFLMAGQSADPDRYEIRLNIEYKDSLGTYPFLNYWPYYATLYDFTDGSTEPQGREYQTDSAHTGSVTITKYTGSVLSGTFYFDAINTSNGHVVHITDGRFDISN